MVAPPAMHASASTRVRLCPWVSRSHLGKFLDRASRGVSARRASVPASFSAPFRTATLPRRTLSPLLARARRPTPAPLRASADAPPDSEDASLSRTPLDPGAVRSPRPGDRVSGDGSRDWGVLVLLAAAAIFVCYADRSNISTAIIPMAHQFGWDKIREGGVLSAFFYGYALTQLLGGRLADRVGGKPVLLFGVLAWSLATFVTPEAAAAGVAPLLIARVTLGAGEGVAFPAVHALIARHVPKERQTTAVAAVTAASYAGAAFAFGVTPSIVVNGGWEAAFYTFGAAAVVWVPLWVPARFAVVNDEFVDGSRASRPERERVANPDSRRAVDWFEEWSGLIRTREVRAICVAQFAQSWGGYGLLSWLPTYFEEALGVPVADLAAFTVLPYFIQGVLGVGSGLWADALIREGKCSVKLVRRVFQTVGMVGPAVCMLAAAALGGAAGGGAAEADVFAAAAAVDVGLALSALTLAGVSVSHLDVAPRHAGLVFATGNTCATAAGIVAVPASGFILEATGQNWSAVFGVIAALYVAGAAVWWAWVGDAPVEADAVTTNE